MLIHAINNAYYTAMNYNAGYSLMQGNMAKMSLLGANNMSPATLLQAEQRLTMQSLQDRLSYKISQTMLENEKSAQEKRARLNTIA